jgi:hypothetical protein
MRRRVVLKRICILFIHRRSDRRSGGFAYFKAHLAHKVAGVFVGLKPGFAGGALALKVIGAQWAIRPVEVTLVGVDRKRRTQAASANIARKRKECTAPFATRDTRIRTNFRRAIAAF